MENNERKREVEIDLLPILKALWSKLWLIVLIGAVFAGIAFGATKAFIKPTYRSGFTAYVNNAHASESLSYQDINAGKQLVDTYVTVIRSNKILEAAAKAAAPSIGQVISVSSFKKMVSTTVQGDTEVIAVYVEHRDPQTAYILANAIANTAPEFMKDIVEGSSMKIIDRPMYNDSRYKPNYLKYTLLGSLIGVLLMIVKIVVDTLRDDTVKSEQEIEEHFALPILGIIPDVLQQTNDKSKDYYSYAYDYGSRRSTRERVSAENNAADRSTKDRKSSDHDRKGRNGSKGTDTEETNQSKRGEKS